MQQCTATDNQLTAPHGSSYVAFSRKLGPLDNCQDQSLVVSKFGKGRQANESDNSGAHPILKGKSAMSTIPGYYLKSISQFKSQCGASAGLTTSPAQAPRLLHLRQPARCLSGAVRPAQAHDNPGLGVTGEASRSSDFKVASFPESRDPSKNRAGKDASTLPPWKESEESCPCSQDLCFCQANMEPHRRKVRSELESQAEQECKDSLDDDK